MSQKNKDLEQKVQDVAVKTKQKFATETLSLQTKKLQESQKYGLQER